MDEFEQEDLGHAEPVSGRPKDSLVSRLSEIWRTQPLLKLMVIMIVVGMALAGALGAFSGSQKPDASRLITAPGINEPPGGKASSYFIEQNKMANEERAQEALRQGGSALPTPVGQNVDFGDLSGKGKPDPLAEFRAETERLKKEIEQERQQNQQQIQMIQQAQRQQPMDETLARAMQKQMESLMEAWNPRGMKVVDGQALKEDEREKKKDSEARAGETSQSTTAATPVAARNSESKTIVQAGTVNYAQLLTEANSDVPGPILAQVLSGPMAGGRAVGSFKTMRDYLVLEFTLINFKGKDYTVNVLALDPNTTLGGMATEVDNRYFDRVILPAAAAFAAQFGQTLGQGKSQVTATDSVVIVDQAGQSYKEALYSGLGQAGTSIAQFLQQEAGQIKPLVRVAVGTPIGLFFLRSVKETPEQNFAPGLYDQNTAAQLQGIAGYETQGGTAIPGYGIVGTPSQSGYPYQGIQGAAGYNTGSYNPYATGYFPSVGQRGGVTILTPGQTGGSAVYYRR